MGFRVLDICYPTTTEALEGFVQNFPFVRGANGTDEFWALNTYSINSTGLITFTIKTSVDGGVSSSKILQLTSCTTPTSFKDTPLRDMSIIDVTVIIGLIFALLIGFGHGISLKGFGK